MVAKRRRKTSVKRRRRLGKKRVALLKALFGGAMPNGLGYEQVWNLSDAVAKNINAKRKKRKTHQNGITSQRESTTGRTRTPWKSR